MFGRMRSVAVATFVVASIGINTSGCDPNGPVGPDTTVTPVPELSISIDRPTAGEKVVKSRSLIGKVSVWSKNLPAGTVLDTAYTIDGVSVRSAVLSVEKGPELVSGDPPVPVSANLAVGQHTFGASVSLRNRTTVRADAAPVPFEVTPRPGQIIYQAHEYNGNIDFFVIDNDGGGTVKRLTNSGGVKNAPMLSPDGKTLVYWDYPSGATCGNFWVANPDGSNARVLMQGVNMPVYSPDGSKIAFVGGCLPNGNYGAFVMNADGSGLKRLLKKPDLVHGDVAIQPYIAWMPNGKEVVTGYDETLSLNPYTNRKVYVRVDVETGAETRIYEDETSQSGRKLLLQVHDVSLDGVWMLMSTPNISSSFSPGRIAVLRTDGSRELRWLTAEGRGDSWPSPCGADYKLVCYRSGTDSQTIRSVDFEGRNDREIYRHINVSSIEAVRRWAWQKVWF